MALLQTAPTQYVDASNGVRFAYRLVGTRKSGSVPLVAHIHFRANMDFWDPLFINTLADRREVIIFDNAGVGRSSGSVPTTFQGWADGLLAFTEAVGLNKFDLLGFSMGGIAVQFVTLTAPEKVRRLIISGSRPFTVPASTVPDIVWPQTQAPAEPMDALSSAVTVEEGKKALELSFFPSTEAGHSAFTEYWRRLNERSVEPLTLTLLDKDGGAANQMTSAINSSKSDPEIPYDRFEELTMPVLIANGNRDLLIPTSRSWELMTQIADAQLIIYPKAGHGFLWQYAGEFASDVNEFLDKPEIQAGL